jgi:indole-3-glycerol phosphate synthase
LLRKDFIFDPYQIYESRACGADALLLIAAILTPKKLGELLDLSHTLQMRCLVETHDEEDIKKALESGAKIIGINNRDLRTFNVDLETTARLRPLIPDDRIIVSESGIKNRGDIQKLQSLRVNAVLVGETLIASTDIAAEMRELL